SKAEPAAVWTRSQPTPLSWTSSFRASKGGSRQVSLARVRKRLDVLLVERGLAESRAQAQALVMAGLVRGYANAGEQVDESAALVLVKPQFEAGRADVGRGGVVRDRDVHRRVLREVAEAALAWPAATVGVVDSGLPGPKGNREFFLHLVHREGASLPDELEDW